MKQILFVDDEPTILDGLRRSMRCLRDQWSMHFCTSGNAAIRTLEQQSIDVIVSDMRMPEMDGAALLTTVHQRWPKVIRFILSGYADLEATMRAAPVAHQYLNKPCQPEDLRGSIERASAIQNLLESDELRGTVGEIKSLPPIPATYAQLVEVLSNPVTTVNEVSAIIDGDLALVAKLLQLTNSSFFGLPRRVLSVTTAVNWLGVQMIKNLVLTEKVFSDLHVPPFSAQWREDLKCHSLLCAQISKFFFSDKKVAEEAFLAATLHDCGKLIFASRFPDSYPRVPAMAKERKLPEYLIERELYGTDHGKVGAYLLGIWGLPYPVVEAVARHHEPQLINSRTFDLVWSTHLANALAVGAIGSDLPDAVWHPGISQFPEITAKLPGWREQCNALTGKG